MQGKGVLLGGIILYLSALGLTYYSIPPGVHRESVQIVGPKGKPCLATIWTPPGTPKAVMLIGHGVSANQGIMGSIAKAYSGQGYVAVTLDYWGHGRSRERFDWLSNGNQLLAWCAWAKEKYPTLPLGYLGHSMGGFAGAVAFKEQAAVGAFVSMGAFPPDFPVVKTAIAAGKYEELFDAGDAARRAEGKAEVLTSPYSDHLSEAWDPVLIKQMVAWTDKTLGVPPATGFSWARWALTLLVTIPGGLGAFMLARQATSLFRGESRAIPIASPARAWSLNPYRAAGMAFGCRGYGAPPRSGGWLRAIGLGVVFSLVIMGLISIMINAQMYTSRLDHPERLLGWLVASLALFPLFLLDAVLLERLALRGPVRRFAVAACTHAIPLLVLGTVLRYLGPGPAFTGMMLCILAIVLIGLADVYASATHSAGDYRSGAVASSVLMGWVLAFWFPLVWG